MINIDGGRARGRLVPSGFRWPWQAEQRIRYTQHYANIVLAEAAAAFGNLLGKGVTARDRSDSETVDGKCRSLRM